MNPDDFLPTRHSLIRRLKNWEDQESWKDFFNTYWKFIYGVALKSVKKVKDRVDSDEFQIFHLHVVKGWPAKKVAGTVGAKLPAVYFAKYKLSRLVKREVERLKKELI